MERPNIECVDLSADGMYGRFEVEPLERGYGITLGNSLRRVLLSSLPGAAITSVKIDGVLHEFSTVPGVVEDVTEILLNLKGLALRLHSVGEEPKVLRIEAANEGPVTGADIVTDADVEVMNPGLHIATLDRGARLSMELTVERGRGYVTVDRNKRPNMALGVIPMDSFFTPIRRVNFAVEDTRVGQVTNFDKLQLEIWTNGAVRPDEAASLAAKIMVQHLNLFSNLTDGVPDVEMTEKEVNDRDRLLEMSIEELDLSVRSFNCLKRAGINTITELVSKTPDEMMKVRNLGRKSLDEVEEKLSALGLTLQAPEE